MIILSFYLPILKSSNALKYVLFEHGANKLQVFKNLVHIVFNP
jgi:hypothetical protein